MNDSTMTKGVTTLVTMTFDANMSTRALDVTDFNGAEPSESNSYLYNTPFAQYEGNVKDDVGQNYTFFIFKENGQWSYQFVPVEVDS